MSLGAETPPPRGRYRGLRRLGALSLLLLGLLALGPLLRRGPALRWVSGDMHLHAATSDGRSVTPLEVLERLEREDLEVGVVHVWGVRSEEAARHFTGRRQDYAFAPERLAMLSKPRLVHYDLEASGFRGLGADRDPAFGGGFPDHVVGLGLDDLAVPRSLFSEPIVEWSARQRAVTGVAHAGIWPAERERFPPRSEHSPADLPACLALGHELFLSTEHVRAPGFFSLYYGLLNCGFRVPLCAGSDWPVASGPPGHPRTYVRVEGPLDYQRWIEGIRAGRTTISANRLDRVELLVEGQGAGAQLTSPQAPATLALELRARLAAPTQLELVRNGAVVASWHLLAGETRLRARVELSDSSWLAARSATTHTGPTYVTLAGRPIRASAADARYFLRHVEHLLRQIQDRYVVWKPNRASFKDWQQIKAARVAIKARLELAHARWEQLLAEARQRNE